jgi:hypothetical protein
MEIPADHGEHRRGEFEVNVGPSTLSHHMETLREAGLTRHRMEGTRCFVSLREDTLQRFPAVLEGVPQAVTAEEREPTPDNRPATAGWGPFAAAHAPGGPGPAAFGGPRAPGGGRRAVGGVAGAGSGGVRRRSRRPR